MEVSGEIEAEVQKLEVLEQCQLAKRLTRNASEMVYRKISMD